MQKTNTLECFNSILLKTELKLIRSIRRLYYYHTNNISTTQLSKLKISFSL